MKPLNPETFGAQLEPHMLTTSMNSLTVPLEGRLFNIRNQWKAPSESRVHQHMSFSSDNVKLYGKDDFNGLVPWHFEAVPDTNNTFHIRNDWRAPTESRAGTYLSIAGDNAVLKTSKCAADRDTWMLTPVPSSTDQFHIRYQGAPGNEHEGKHLSFSGSNIRLYDTDDDLVPWQINLARLTPQEVKDILYRDLRDILAPNVSIRLADAHYYTPSVKHAKAIIKGSDANLHDWLSERFDCDDFAISLKRDFAYDAYHKLEYTAGHAFGMLWGPFGEDGHAVNWMINDDMKVRLIEPQSDTVYMPTDAWSKQFHNVDFLIS
jgi:hypothetical protein